MSKRILIVGGVAGGATASAHARRVPGDAEIVMFEVFELDPSKQQIQICDLNSNKEYWETYDDLVISTSASPLKPSIFGIDQEGILSVRGITDVEARGEFVCSYFLKEIKKSRKPFHWPLLYQFVRSLKWSRRKACHIMDF